jgi:LPXTG-motif cell wall-anchored protein
MSFGGYLAVLVPVMLSMIFFFKGALRVFSFLVFISAIFILPNTGSRSSLIALFLSLVVFLGFYLINLKKQKSFSLKKSVRLGAVVLLIAVVLISVLISSKDSIVYKRLDELRIAYKEGGLEKALAERSASQWKMAAKMIVDYPFTGVGIGAFIIELPNYAETAEISLRTTDSAENYFLQVGSELGTMGLFFALWIFWLIFKEIKKGFNSYLSQGRWKHIRIGVSCGIISMFMIFFVHTYIGSYELKYTFWLLVGLLFVINRGETKPESRIYFSKKFKIFSLVLILIFSGVHLWNSTRSLSLKNRTQRLDLKQNFGLYPLEKTEDGREFRWTRGYGGLTIKIEEPVIEIPMQASHPDIGKNPLRVKIYLIKDFFKEKRLLDEVLLTENSWKTVEYYIPEEVNQQAILLFKVSRTWNPLKTFGTPDPRNLGIAVGKINFKTLDR